MEQYLLKEQSTTLKSCSTASTGSLPTGNGEYRFIGLDVRLQGGTGMMIFIGKCFLMSPAAIILFEASWAVIFPLVCRLREWGPLMFIQNRKTPSSVITFLVVSKPAPHEAYTQSGKSRFRQCVAPYGRNPDIEMIV